MEDEKYNIYNIYIYIYIYMNDAYFLKYYMVII